jgi:hypothetical protein
MLELRGVRRREEMGAVRTGRGPQPFIGLETGGGTGAASMAGHEGVGYM